MHFTNTIIIAALVAACSAAPSRFRIAANNIDYPWDISNWNAECQLGWQQCRFNFTLTADGNTTTYPMQPFVQAHCSGQDIGAPYARCDIIEGDRVPTAVAAKLLPSPPSTNLTLNGTMQPAEIQVSLQHISFESSSVQWNYTGRAVTAFNGWTAEPLEFRMTPSEIWGIA